MVLTSGVLRGVRTALLVVASALVMVLAGCGQKDDTGSGAPPADATTVGGPVTILVAAAPGGAEDLMNRLLAPKLSEVLGVDVAIKNAVGGGGLEAIQELQANDADGRTLLAVSPPGEYMSKLGGAELGDESYTMIGSANTDPGLLLARRTEWLEQDDWSIPLGQRMLVTDAGETALMDLRHLELLPAPPAG